MQARNPYQQNRYIQGFFWNQKSYNPRCYCIHAGILKFSFSEKATKMWPYGFEIYLVNVKTIRMIAQIFVAFSEKLNFIAWLKS